MLPRWGNVQGEKLRGGRMSNIPTKIKGLPKNHPANVAFEQYQKGVKSERVRVRETIKKLPENVDGDIHFNSKEDLLVALGLNNEVRR